MELHHQIPEVTELCLLTAVDSQAQVMKQEPGFQTVVTKYKTIRLWFDKNELVNFSSDGLINHYSHKLKLTVFL